MHIKYITRQ